MPVISPVSFKRNAEFNVLYFSDVHGKPANVARLKSATDEFDKKNKNKRTLKLAGGDLNMASDVKPNYLILKLMNIIGLDASSVGNHDLEGGNYWLEAIQKAKINFKFLSSNLNFTEKHELQHIIKPSTIIEKQGEKVGIIGVSPPDYNNLSFEAPYNYFVNVKDINQTAETIRKEVKKLEAQGINKIFLLAHTGNVSNEGTEFYKTLAQIGGIDVIIGGHDHAEFDFWFNSERNEPVKVVSVGKAKDKKIYGKDLDSFGILKTVFDEKGRLIKDRCKNEVKITQNYPKSKEITKFTDQVMKGKELIAYSKEEIGTFNRKTQENPAASLLADSMLWQAQQLNPESNVSIALINSNKIKGILPKGKILMKDIKNTYPFTHEAVLAQTTLTKKQLFDALNWGIKESSSSNPSLGLLQVGGVQYTVGKNNRVKNVYITNQDGVLGECLDNAPEDKRYSVIYDISLMSGKGGMSALRKDLSNTSDVKIYPINHQSSIIEYLKQNFKNKPVEIKTGRIIFE